MALGSFQIRRPFATRTKPESHQKDRLVVRHRVSVATTEVDEYPTNGSTMGH